MIAGGDDRSDRGKVTAGVALGGAASQLRLTGKEGAELGAAIGLPAGPAGVAIGAVGGAIIGGIVGGIAYQIGVNDPPAGPTVYYKCADRAVDLIVAQPERGE